MPVGVKKPRPVANNANKALWQKLFKFHSAAETGLTGAD